MLLSEQAASDPAPAGIRTKQRREVKKERRFSCSVWACECPRAMMTRIPERVGQAPQEQLRRLCDYIAANGSIGGNIALKIDRSGVSRGDSYDVSQIHR
jgi:hypothetical protein